MRAPASGCGTSRWCIDLWDYDPTAAPQLVTVRGGPGRSTPSQATKQGFVFVFDRVSGEPVWPIEGGRCRSDVPGEQHEADATLLTLPPSARQIVNPTIHAVSHQRCRRAARTSASRRRARVSSMPALVEKCRRAEGRWGHQLGNTAANPAAGVLCLLNRDFPSFYKLSSKTRKRWLTAARASLPDAATIQRGQALYRNRAPCAMARSGSSSAAPSLVTIGKQIGFPSYAAQFVWAAACRRSVTSATNGEILAFLGAVRVRVCAMTCGCTGVPAWPSWLPAACPGRKHQNPAAALQNYPEVSMPARRYA